MPLNQGRGLLAPYLVPAFLLLAALQLIAPAQGVFDIPLDQSSGSHHNTGTAAQAMWTDGVTIPGAASIQLKFTQAMLPTFEDRIVVTSLLDGEQMVITRLTLKQFQNHTAWFNGSSVTVSLIVGAGSTASVDLERVFADTPPVFPDTICGPTDNRVVTTDDRTCRVVPSGTSTCSYPGPCAASAWRIGASPVIATARHVAVLSFFTVAEFNAPASGAATGAIVHPPVADQFPILNGTIQQSAASTIGDDWAIAMLGMNSLGQTAPQRYGAGFTLASSIPAVGTTLRITGNGIDNTPDLTRHHRTQTATGPYTGASGTRLLYQVDTTNGNSGSAVINNATGQVIGIHTNAGCGPTSGSNSGTSILNAGLQTAINNLVSCATLNLPDGVSQYISSTCPNASFYLTPNTSKWNVVGVSSSSDWDLNLSGTPSALGGSTTDFVLANGHLGTPTAPTPGTMYRFSGTSSARGEFASAATMNVGTTANAYWSSTDVVQAFEFNVTTAGSYGLTVAGSSGLKWRLYGPGSNASWRPRSSSTVIGGTGTAGGGSGNKTLGTGWHCLVVFKDSAAGSVTPSQFSVTVCSASSLQAISTSPSTITNPCSPFSLTPVASRWNVVGISSPSDWDLVIGSMTGYTGGSDYALANGRDGTVSPTNGHFVRFSGSSDGTAQARGASTGSVGGYFSHTFSGNEILEAREINVTSAGTYDVTVTGDSTASWKLHSPPGNAAWFNESTNVVTSGSANGATSTVTLATGYHVLVMYRNYGPASATTTVLANVCPSTPAVALSGFNPQTVTADCVPFTFSVDANKWNAVGAQSTSDWDIAAGSAQSATGVTATDFVIANGHNGTTGPLNGVVNRYSGSDSANIMRSYNVSLFLGTPYNIAGWSPSRVIRVFEFEVTTAGSYDITMSNAAPLKWRLFDPGTGSGFRARNTAIASGTSDVTSTQSLSPGWHALAVTTDTGPVAASFTFGMLVEPTPNPVPSAASLSPSTATAGNSSFPLTVNGSSFVSGAQIRFNGSVLTTSFVSSSQLTATVPASLISAAASVPVDVVNPAPGGGSSAPLTFTINNPAPGIGSLSPSSRIAGSAAFTLTVAGSNFNSSTAIRWNGLSQSTTLVSSSLVSCTIPAAYITTAGTSTVSVSNPSPGGGTTGGLTFTVNNPVPAVTTATPNSALVGSPAFLILVNGSNFNPSSVIQFDGTSLPTTFLNSASVRASVPTSLLATAGVVIVGVQNPTPGGGLASTSFTIENPVPTASTLSPSYAIAGESTFSMNVNGTGFVNGASTVHWNGTPLATSFVSATQLQVTIPALLIATPGTAAVEVTNVGPGGGTTAPVNFPILAPAIASITPSSIPIMTLASPIQTITVTGANFHPGTQAYADGIALPTTYINSSTLTCTVAPTVPGALRRGALAIAVENGHTIPSNSVACVVGGLGNNHGTIQRNPLAPLPGEAYAAVAEDGLPGAPLLLLADLTNPTPVYPWPSATGNFVLSVRDTQPVTPGSWFVVADGIGVFGPPTPGIAYDASGTFALHGFTVPNPAWGLTLTVQGAYIDPGSPLGFTLHWARYPDQL